jgi:hypothetical protein
MTGFNLALELSCNLMNLIRISVTRVVTVGQGASGGIARAQERAPRQRCGDTVSMRAAAGQR